MILWEILIINSVLQAATILVAMASEKNFGDQNSGEIRQLATNRFKEKLNNMSWSVPPSCFFLFFTTEFFYGHHQLQLKIAKRWLFEKVSLERCNFFDFKLSCDCHFCIESFRRNHEQTSSKIHGIHLSSARRCFLMLNRIRHQEVISKVCSCRHWRTY